MPGRRRRPIARAAVVAGTAELCTTTRSRSTPRRIRQRTTSKWRRSRLRQRPQLHPPPRSPTTRSSSRSLLSSRRRGSSLRRSSKRRRSKSSASEAGESPRGGGAALNARGEHGTWSHERRVRPFHPTGAGRWEWRLFGETAGAAEDRFAALAVERVQESDELYLLSPARDATVKVRNELMDVKRRQRVSTDGLQQWAPAMKAEFPVPARQVRSVAAALRIPAPAFARAVYTLPQLVEELVGPNPALHPVPVHKKRARIHDRRVQRGGDRRAGSRTADEDDRRGVGGPRDSASRPCKLGLEARSERQLPSGPGSVPRYRDPTLRGRRRRHELGEIPDRQAGGRRYVESRRRSCGGDTSGRGPPGRPGSSAPIRCSARSPPSPTWPTRLSGTRSAPSRRSGRPACGSRATARRS